MCVATKSRNWTHLPLSACGTKPWPHSSTVVKRFYYVPSTHFVSFSRPPLRPVTTLPTALLVQNEFFIEIDALSFHWVCNPPQHVLHILLFCSMTRQIYVLKKWLSEGSGWSVGGTLRVGLDWSAYRLSCMVLTLLNFHPRFTVWYVWVKSSAVVSQKALHHQYLRHLILQT